MCDQANHDNCEIVDELHLEITNLEMTIADLKKDILEDLKLEKEWLKADNYDETALIEQHIKKWEAK